MKLFEWLAQPHVVKLFYGARCQPVTTSFFTGEMFAFHDGDTVAKFGGPVTHGCAGWAATNHQHVGVAHGHAADLGEFH